MPVPGFGWVVLERPPWGFAAPTVFAGCGVLKPLNILELCTLGAFVAPCELFSVLPDAVSLFCAFPNRLGPGVEAPDEALVVPFGFARDANKLGLGVSAAELLPESAGLRLLKRLFEVAEFFSCP